MRVGEVVSAGQQLLQYGMKKFSPAIANSSVCSVMDFFLTLGFVNEACPEMKWNRQPHTASSNPIIKFHKCEPDVQVANKFKQANYVCVVNEQYLQSTTH